MRARQRTIRLKAGDVRILRIFRGKRFLRLAIYDEDKAVPLTHALLGAAERQALRTALGSDK